MYYFQTKSEDEGYVTLMVMYAPSQEFLEQELKNSNCYYSDSIEDAIKHFNIQIKDGSFYIPNKDEEALKSIGVAANESKDFRTTLNSLLAEMPNSEALQNVILFPTWAPDTHYVAGERIRYDNTLYRVIQTHISQPDWLPNIVTSLFTPIILEAE